jgi:hypothetical protein
MIAFNNLPGILALTAMLAGTVGLAAPVPNPQRASVYSDMGDYNLLGGRSSSISGRAEEAKSVEDSLISGILGLGGDGDDGRDALDGLLSLADRGILSPDDIHGHPLARAEQNINEDSFLPLLSSVLGGDKGGGLLGGDKGRGLLGGILGPNSPVGGILGGLLGGGGGRGGGLLGGIVRRAELDTNAEGLSISGLLGGGNGGGLLGGLLGSNGLVGGLVNSVLGPHGLLGGILRRAEQDKN